MKYTTFDVTATSRSYPVIVGQDLVENASEFIADLGDRAFILTDDTVAELLLEPLSRGMKEVGLKSFTKAVKQGEAMKSLEIAREIYDFFAKNTAARSDVVVALGGGVIGDLAGFVASTFKRGMRLVQIPTTLLSQVDSAIGGKTAVNLPHGKNLVGTFYQPHAVIADVCVLGTLPTCEFRSGLAEVIKYGVSLDKDLFELIRGNRQDILSRTPEVLALVVEKCLRTKAQIVEEDEREEKGEREVLNYGHTVGHAIEVCAGYRLPHGFAVAIGIAEEARFAARLGLFDTDSLELLITTLSMFELPTEIPPTFDADEMELAIRQDKKIRRDKLRVPVLVDIGRTKMMMVDGGSLIPNRRME